MCGVPQHPPVLHGYVRPLRIEKARILSGSRSGGVDLRSTHPFLGSPFFLRIRNRQDLKNFDDPKDKRKCGLYSTKETVDNDTMSLRCRERWRRKPLELSCLEMGWNPCCSSDAWKQGLPQREDVSRSLSSPSRLEV